MRILGGDVIQFTFNLFQLHRGSHFSGICTQSTWGKPPTCRKPLTNLSNNLLLTTQDTKGNCV